MKFKSKHIISIILSVTLLLGAFPFAVSANSLSPSKSSAVTAAAAPKYSTLWIASDFTYTLSGTSMTITGLTSSGSSYLTSVNGKLEIPSKIKVGITEYTVTRIGEAAFAGTVVTLADFPDTVTYIDTLALANCQKLTRVNFRRMCPSVTTFGSIMGLGIFWSTPKTNLRIGVPFGRISAYSDNLSYDGIAISKFDANLPCPCANPYTCSFRLGDINGDGKITNRDDSDWVIPVNQYSDVTQIMKYIVDLPSYINNNPDALKASLITPASKAKGKPSIDDALEILKFLAGVPSLIPG